MARYYNVCVSSEGRNDSTRDEPQSDSVTVQREDGSPGNRWIKAHNAQRPRMTNVNGATWDSEKAVIDGETIRVYSDKTWGECLYFEKDGSWFRFKLYSNELPVGHTEMTVGDIFRHSPPVLSRVSKDAYDRFVQRVEHKVKSGGDN